MHDPAVCVPLDGSGFWVLLARCWPIGGVAPAESRGIAGVLGLLARNLDFATAGASRSSEAPARSLQCSTFNSSVVSAVTRPLTASSERSHIEHRGLLEGSNRFESVNSYRPLLFKAADAHCRSRKGIHLTTYRPMVWNMLVWQHYGKAAAGAK